MQFKAVYLCKSFRKGPSYVLLEQNRRFHAGVWFFSQWDRKMHEVKARLIGFVSFWSSADLLCKSWLMITKPQTYKSLSDTSLAPIKVFIFIYIFKKMRMLSVFWCEDYLRSLVYPEIDFLLPFFFLMARKAVTILFFHFCHYYLNAVLHSVSERCLRTLIFFS